jgi:HSP20 family molecular chaperone IbpA
MSGSDRQSWLNWDQIEKFVGQRMPFRGKGQSFLDNMSWIEEYVQGVLKKAIPSGPPNILPKDDIETEVFETHTHVIVQVKLEKEEDPHALQVYVKSGQVKVTGLLSGYRIIKLPTLVLPKTARARYKQRILQIEIRKRGRKESYQEAYIRY